MFRKLHLVLFQDPKPLMWERLKHDQRFRQIFIRNIAKSNSRKLFSFVNQSQIVHVIVDDVIDKKTSKSNMWYNKNMIKFENI